MRIINPFLILICCLLAFTASAQNNERSGPVFQGKVSSVQYVSSLASRPFDLLPAQTEDREVEDKRSLANEVSMGEDPQTQNDFFVRNRHSLERSRTQRAPSIVYDAYASNSQPTDPALAVGPNHVMVVFNTGFTIYDKAGNQLVGQTSPSPAIFPNGGCCDLTASYDNAANRWVLSFLGGGAQIAISDGPDPVNAGWYVYTISSISDYQKLSVWSDGYYMTDNTGSNNKVWALERDAMLAGDPNAQILGFNLPGISTSGFYSPQAFNVTNANLPAPGGAPIVYMQDDAWSGVSSDHVKLWTVDVDWTTPGNSTVSAAQEISVTSFIGVFDNGSFSNLTQPGGGIAIDALQATIMNQAQFRKFPTYNSALFNFVVDTDASSGELAGIRWMELRQSGDNQPWSLYQEGTYTAPDGRHAWNGSLAMDGNGNIGMGYSSMSGPSTPSTVYVSSYYTSRLSGDPLGTMTGAESLISSGNANIPGLRYGDYCKIDVDPVDDATFWFINEYMNNGRKGVVGAFQVQAGPPDNENPTDPSNLTATNITFEGATLNWTASTDNIGVALYNIFIDGNQVGTSSTTTFDVTGLSPLTTYTASVNAQDAAGNTSNSVSTSFTTLDAPPASYCNSASTNVNDEYIGRVQLNTIDNTSGAQFYTDFTSISTNLTEGQTYTITVTPVWTATIYPEGYAVWIDYNGDADFEDAGELVWSLAPTTSTPVSGSFTVPSGTVQAATRMRVSLKYNGIPTPCETFTWGEVEDYTVVLGTGGGPDTDPPSTPLNLTASNITDNSVDLSWDASTDNVGVTGYEIFQDGSSIGTVTGTSTTVPGLTPNTTYDFNVSAFDAAGNSSGLSNTETITTTGGGGGGPGEIAAYYFETGFDGWIDGGGDCARINNANRAFEGSYSIRLRDDSNTSNAVSPELDLSAQTEITIEYHVMPRSMEPGEDFFLEFFNGSSYEVLANYVSGVDFSNNVFINELLTLSANDYNFTTNNRLRFRCDASANNDRIFFDQVIISGDNVGGSATDENTNALAADQGQINYEEALHSFTKDAIQQVRIYPNPTNSMINIDIREGDFDDITVFSASGQIMYVAEPDADQLNIDVSNFKPGMYFVRFVSNGLAITKRFVKE